MRTGKVAKALGIDQKTITNWLNRDELKDLFSPGARMDVGKSQRDFNMDDQLILNSIRYLRNDQGEKDWEKIAAEIQRGYRQTEMPDSYYTTETTTSMQVYTKMIEIKNQLDLMTTERNQLHIELENERTKSQNELTEQRARFEIEFDIERTRLRGELKEERIRLQGELKEERTRLLTESDKDRIRLQGELKEERQEIIDLNRQLARLELRIELLQENEEDED
jgi:hypothetical protein